eukprot:TRINITY_DN15466_c0_g1_i1.p2 TRINITY_DN15466_c0_g1~~TRINITY_DN15466_c0_g1_i1.p2  ORF type:complete len:136 (+),score=10.85 TRINITY_DN15466_c0_g1_i1:83-490(+)
MYSPSGVDFLSSTLHLLSRVVSSRHRQYTMAPFAILCCGLCCPPPVAPPPVAPDVPAISPLGSRPLIAVTTAAATAATAAEPGAAPKGWGCTSCSWSVPLEDRNWSSCIFRRSLPMYSALIRGRSSETDRRHDEG